MTNWFLILVRVFLKILTNKIELSSIQETYYMLLTNRLKVYTAILLDLLESEPKLSGFFNLTLYRKKVKLDPYPQPQ